MQYTDKSVVETSQPLPTLSTKGWVYGMDEKIDLTFSYYLTSQYSQTLCHIGDVRSLQYSVQRFYSDPPRLADQVKEDLEALLKPYIDYIEINVDYQKRNEGPAYDFTINIFAIHDGRKWEKFSTLRFKDSKFEVINAINTSGRVSLA